MRRAVVGVLLVSTWLLPSTAWAGKLTPRSRVSTAGLGPVKIGMTKARAERAGGVRLVRMGPALGACSYVRPRDRSIRASFMMIRGRVARVDVGRRGIRTVSGFRVGDRGRAVRKRFAGQLRVTRHEYDPKGRYLEVVPRDRSERDRRVVFETDGRRVTSIRAGRLPEARYVEGCA